MIHRENYSDAKPLAAIEHLGFAFKVCRKKGRGARQHPRFVLVFDGLATAQAPTDYGLEPAVANWRESLASDFSAADQLRARLAWLRGRGGADLTG